MKDSAKCFEWALEEAVKRSNEEERRRLLLEAEDVCGMPTVYSRHLPSYARTTSASVFRLPWRVGAGEAVFSFDSTFQPSSLSSNVSANWEISYGGDGSVSGRGASLPVGAIRRLLD